VEDTYKMLKFLLSIWSWILSWFHTTPLSSAGRVKRTFAALATGAVKNVLPPGKYVQIYRDAVRGRNHAEKIASMAAELDKLKALGVKGILWHGFPSEMTPAVFQELAALCSARGLLALAAFGLGDTDPEGAGRKIAAVANLPECFAVVFDMEGAWENEPGDKQKAVLIGKAFRDLAPNALAFDQPWPVPNYHSSFPWEETAAFIDVRAPQYYVNDWASSKGAARYAFCWNWFNTAWTWLNTKRLGPKGLVKPVIYTIQGYRWVFKDLVNCLTSFPTVFIWAEPYPDDVFMAALGVAQKLESLGFTGPSAVQNFQNAWNRAHPQDLIGSDNACGPVTVSKLGLPPPPPSH
jgi:hypothetical protein